jgi:hypothetical protein
LHWIAYGLLPRDALWASIDYFVVTGGVAGRMAVGRLRA